MYKQLYLRAFSITTLKNIVFILALNMGLLFLGDKIPAFTFGIIFQAIYFLNTFLFSEWLFKKGECIPLIPLGIVILGTYVWDSFVALLFNSWLFEWNLFVTQEFLSHLYLFVIHAAAMAAAYYVRKRFGAERSLSEGLEA
jgi:hypothetical protein